MWSGGQTTSKMNRNQQLLLAAPYDVTQLQQEFFSLSPRETYVLLCERAHCKPIAAISRLFPPDIATWDEVVVLDFSRTYVGPRGALPIIDLCRRLPQLRQLNFADSYFTNEVVWQLAQMAVMHPSLESIELSRNELISWTGAMCLAELAVQNQHIVFIGLRGVTVQPQILDAIFMQTRRNAVAQFNAVGGRPCPSESPFSLYIRALKAFFATRAVSGEATPDDLVAGCQHWRMLSGREMNDGRHTERLFERLKARAPAVIVWDAFLVLLLIEGSTYDEAVVSKLKQVFLEFNLNTSTSVPLDEGYVLARELGAILVRLHDHRANDVALEATRSRIGALYESTTLCWDDFLYLLYPHGPQKGKRFPDAMSTGLQSQKEVMVSF